MAIEYTLRSDARAEQDDLRKLLVTALDGRSGPDGTVFRDGMYVTAWQVPEGEGYEVTRLLGFEHRVTAVFHFDNLADPATRDHNVAAMVGAVLAHFDQYRSHGVLLFNGEEIVLQRLTDEVVFNSDWEDWSELDEVAPLLVGHALRSLPQRLM
ncbi:SitI3 family protein [Actinoplanes sp. GCM10030250]|uniref:SitI3 family protein n=1 Tax=Actinoplanes sp. GCM10030250 TaxID=3273376 RepID=UPI003618C1D3